MLDRMLELYMNFEFEEVDIVIEADMLDKDLQLINLNFQTIKVATEEE